MALVGFPDEIIVTLGTAWDGKNGLDSGDTLTLTKVSGQTYYTEDGTNTANNSTNRLKFRPESGFFNYAHISAADSGWTWLGQAGYYGGSNYTFQDVYDSGTMNQWSFGVMAGFLTDSFADYNGEVFSAFTIPPASGTSSSSSESSSSDSSKSSYSGEEEFVFTINVCGLTSARAYYYEDGTQGGKPTYSNLNGVTIRWSGSRWIVNHASNRYYHTSDTATPPETGWSVYGGQPFPPPTIEYFDSDDDSSSSSDSTASSSSDSTASTATSSSSSSPNEESSASTSSSSWSSESSHSTASSVSLESDSSASTDSTASTATSATSTSSSSLTSVSSPSSVSSDSSTQTSATSESSPESSRSSETSHSSDTSATSNSSSSSESTETSATSATSNSTASTSSSSSSTAIGASNTTFAGRIAASFDFTATKILDLSTPKEVLKYTKNQEYKNGILVDEADIDWHDRRILDPLEAEELNLYGSLLTGVGTWARFDQIKSVMIYNKSENATLVVGDATASAFESWTNDSGSTIKILPQSVYWYTAPNNGGLDVGSDVLYRIENISNYEATYDIILIGVGYTQ